MQHQSSAPAHPSTREQRGLALYRRGGIERIARDLYIVPSHSERRVEYLVDLERQSCECRDHARTGGPCKHVYAAMLYQAWIRRSARVVATSGAFDAGRDGLDMAAHSLELHHRVPRCLLRLHDRAVSGELDGAGIAAWLEFEHEAMRYGVDVEISREDLAELVEASTVLLARDEHRGGHQSDWQRWGRRGGLETARRYGSSWFALLALRRWGRISPADLDARAKASGRRS